MLLSLDQVKFNRCFKPLGAVHDPSLITFNDGNPYAFGVCAYTLYDLENGTKYSVLLMAKAKHGPLTDKGETVKNVPHHNLEMAFLLYALLSSLSKKKCELIKPLSFSLFFNGQRFIVYFLNSL